MGDPSRIETNTLVKIFGNPGSPKAYAIRDFLHRSDVPFEWIQLATDEQARSQAGVDHLQDSRLPVCIFPDGTRVECPTLRQITEKLGWFRSPLHSEYDLAIYGAGPAGLSAAVYGASEGLKTVLIERSAIGGKPEPAPRLRIISGFPRESAGRIWPSAPASRPAVSEPKYFWRAKASAASFRPGKGPATLRTARRLLRAPPSARPGSRTGALACRTRTSTSERACTTALARAKLRW